MEVLNASPSEHTVTVGYDDDKVAVDQLRKALESVGYTMGDPVPVR